MEVVAKIESLILRKKYKEALRYFNRLTNLEKGAISLEVIKKIQREIVKK